MLGAETVSGGEWKAPLDMPAWRRHREKLEASRREWLKAAHEDAVRRLSPAAGRHAEIIERLRRKGRIRLRPSLWERFWAWIRWRRRCRR